MSATPAPEQNGHAPPSDARDFRPCPDATLGVELEIQVLDPATDELVPGAQRILDACEQEGLAGVDGEFLLSMIEVKTGVCKDVAEVREQLCPLMRRVGNIASTVGFDLAVGATHPFSRPTMSAVSPHERYQRIRRRQGWLAYQETIYGLHVHVGVPGAAEAVGLMNLLTPWLPHLLALSANSPFWQGVDTEFASARAALFRPAAHAGVPPHHPSWEDFLRFYEVMRQGGAIESVKDLYWDIRPRPDFGTLELRIFDAPHSLSCLLGLAALTRCLVIDGLRRLREGPELARGDPYRHWLAAENKSMAARYGLQAECQRRPGGPRITLAEDLDRLFERLLPVAREVGEDGFLAPLVPAARFETGAARHRRVYRQAGAWRDVIHGAKAQWARDLEEQSLPDAAPPAEPGAGPGPVSPSRNGAARAVSPAT